MTIPDMLLALGAFCLLGGGLIHAFVYLLRGNMPTRAHLTVFMIGAQFFFGVFMLLHFQEVASALFPSVTP